MGAAAAMEAQALVHWGSARGWGPFGMHGISLGGVMACIGAGLVSKPVALAPCLVGTSSAHLFAHGALSDSVDWSALQRDLPALEAGLPDFAEAAAAAAASAAASAAEVGAGATHDAAAPILSSTTAAAAKLASSSSSSSQQQPIRDTLAAVMEDFTNLGHYPRPAVGSSVVVVQADSDGYVTPGVRDLDKLYYEKQCRALLRLQIEREGHVTSYLRRHDAFRAAIAIGLQRMRNPEPQQLPVPAPSGVTT
eukprot:UC1_evm1s469